MSRTRIPESSTALSVVAFAVIVLLLLFAKVVLIPLAFALTLSFTLAPAVSLLERWGVRRIVAVTLMSLLTCVCVGSGAYVVSRQVLSVAQTLPSYRNNIHQKIESLHSTSESRLADAITMIEDVAGALAPGSASNQGNAVPVRVVGERSDQLQASVSLVGTILQPIGQFGIVIIFAFYMLMNREELRHRVLLLAGMGNMNVMTQALDDASARISQFLVMQLQINAFYGLAFGIGLRLLHVPDATLWGVIGGALRFVPYLGTLAGMVLPLTLSIAISTSWWNPLLVLGLFLVLESTTANIMEPWLFSSRTGISSLALLSSAIFWSMLWGLPGLVLSTPLTVCVVVLAQYVPQLSFLHSLLGTDAALSPAASVYERLLAMDQAEALSVAEAYLDGKPLAELYDLVILPVLALAEEDRHKGVLTDVRWKFVLRCIGELIARLSEYQPTGAPGEQPSDNGELLHLRNAPPQNDFATICISAGDEANGLATAMLSQLLERAGCQTLTLDAESLSDEILMGLAAGKDTVVFLSALPPFAFSQTRALCQRVRTHMHHNRILVALWNSTEDADDMLARFGTTRPEIVVSTLTRALAEIESWRFPTRRY